MTVACRQFLSKLRKRDGAAEGPSTGASESSIAGEGQGSQDRLNEGTHPEISKPMDGRVIGRTINSVGLAADAPDASKSEGEDGVVSEVESPQASRSFIYTTTILTDTS